MKSVTKVKVNDVVLIHKLSAINRGYIGHHYLLGSLAVCEDNTNIEYGDFVGEGTFSELHQIMQPSDYIILGNLYD